MKHVPSLKEVNTKLSRTDLLAQEGLTAAALEIDRSVFQKDWKEKRHLKYFKKYHNTLKSTMNTSAAKKIFMADVMKHRNSPLNANIRIC